MLVVKNMWVAGIVSLLMASQADADSNIDIVGTATVAAGPKNAAVKTVTNFSASLRCMDELFLGYGKQGIVITSAGIPDETGKVKTGTKEMVISAIAKMTVKSNAFEFIDFHSQGDDLKNLFDSLGERDRKIPDYYVRGSITQMDDQAVNKNTGIGFSLPFLDFGLSKQQGYDVISMDMSVGEAATRKILSATSTSNTMVITKGGRSGETGGKIGNLGLSFNMDLSKSEGVGATTRTLVELGLIEALGKFTQVPYWKCLNADLTNPHLREQALETFESLKYKDLVLFIQRKLGGSMNRYKGPIDGVLTESLKTIIAEYQAQTGLIADGKINFDLYASLLDDTQNELAALPKTPSYATYAAAANAANAAVVPPVRPEVPTTGTTPFQIRLDTDRGANPTYRIGDYLDLNLSVNSHGTAYCYYEDASRTTVRLFPNQFHADSVLKAGGNTRLTGGGFRIKFDRTGSERVACIGADREMLVPSSIKGTPDLRPLGRSLDDIVSQFKQGNPAAEVRQMTITVTR